MRTKINVKELENKILNGEYINDDEIRFLLLEEYFDKEEEIEHSQLRWVTVMETIIEVEGRYFSIMWQRGLTEYQDNEYEGQYLQEVQKRAVQVIKTIWERV